MIRRRVSTIAYALSLLLCLATAALWVRSYLWWDQYKSGISSPGDPFVYIVIVRGGVQWAQGTDFPDRYKLPAGWHSERHGPRDDNWQVMTGWGTFIDRRFLGWRYASGDIDWQHGPAMPFWSVRIPFYALVVLFALLPARQFLYGIRKWQRAKRRGHCPECDYSLTGNVSGVCPECGTRVEEKAQAKA